MGASCLRHVGGLGGAPFLLPGWAVRPLTPCLPAPCHPRPGLPKGERQQARQSQGGPHASPEPGTALPALVAGALRPPGPVPRPAGEKPARRRVPRPTPQGPGQPALPPKTGQTGVGPAANRRLSRLDWAEVRKEVGLPSSSFCAPTAPLGPVGPVCAAMMEPPGRQARAGEEEASAQTPA